MAMASSRATVNQWESEVASAAPETPHPAQKTSAKSRKRWRMLEAVAATRGVLRASRRARGSRCGAVGGCVFQSRCRRAHSARRGAGEASKRMSQARQQRRTGQGGPRQDLESQTACPCPPPPARPPARSQRVLEPPEGAAEHVEEEDGGRGDASVAHVSHRLRIVPRSAAWRSMSTGVPWGSWQLLMGRRLSSRARVGNSGCRSTAAGCACANAPSIRTQRHLLPPPAAGCSRHWLVAYVCQHGRLGMHRHEDGGAVVPEQDHHAHPNSCRHPQRLRGHSGRAGSGGRAGGRKKGGR